MTDARPLRLGLEPGYDGDRVGAWLLDLPGAFGSGANRGLAVSQSPGVAGWWREWLARHGEEWPLGWIGPVEVVEEVTAEEAEGSGRMDSFRADSAAVDADALEAAVRRVGYARADLLALRDHLAVVDTRDGERTADEVLRHLASTEIWLASRLDPAARYTGRLDDPDPVTLLADTRAWAVDTLRRLQAGPPAARRTDSRGEPWTLAKVVRRFVYHAVDHLRELDRRVARAENRVARLRWTREPLPDVDALARLLRSVGWDRRTRDRERLERAIGASQATIQAWDGDELVAFARELGDGVFNAWLTMVIVDPRWQGLGLSGRLVSELMEGRPNVRFALNAADGVDALYRGFGFVPDASAMVRPRPDRPL